MGESGGVRRGLPDHSFQRLRAQYDSSSNLPVTPRDDPPVMGRLDFREYGTALAIQRTTMAYVRTAVSVAGLGRTSSSARVQYVCDAAALLILMTGVSQHWGYGMSMFQLASDEREGALLRTFYSQGWFYHYALLGLGLFIGLGGSLAAFVWMDKLPGPIPFVLTAS